MVLLSLRTIWNFVFSIIVITQKAISSYHWPAMSSWMTIKLKWWMLCQNFNSSFWIEMRDRVQQVTTTCIIHALCNRVFRLRIHFKYNGWVHFYTPPMSFGINMININAELKNTRYTVYFSDNVIAVHIRWAWAVCTNIHAPLPTYLRWFGTSRFLPYPYGLHMKLLCHWVNHTVIQCQWKVPKKIE